MMYFPVQYLAFIHLYTKLNRQPPAQADIQRYVPGGRFGRPEEIAAVVTFLASVNFAGRSSMEVGIKVLSADILSSKRRHTPDNAEIPRQAPSASAPAHAASVSANSAFCTWNSPGRWRCTRDRRRPNTNGTKE